MSKLPTESIHIFIGLLSKQVPILGPQSDNVDEIAIGLRL